MLFFVIVVLFLFFFVLFLVILEPLGSSWLEKVILGEQALWVTGPTSSPSLLPPGLWRCEESQQYALTGVGSAIYSGP